MQKLRTNSPHALYHSIFRPEIGQCKDVPVVPITFPFQESKLSISLQTVPTTEQKLHINLGFKTRNSTAVLAHGTGKTVDGAVGLWEVGYPFPDPPSMSLYTVIDVFFFFFFFSYYLLITVKTE